MSHLFRDKLRHVGINDIARLHHLALLHEQLDHINGTFRHAVRQLLNRNRIRHCHFAHDFLARAGLLRTLLLLALATH